MITITEKDVMTLIQVLKTAGFRREQIIQAVEAYRKGEGISMQMTVKQRETIDALLHKCTGCCKPN